MFTISIGLIGLCAEQVRDYLLNEMSVSDYRSLLIRAGLLV